MACALLKRETGENPVRSRHCVSLRADPGTLRKILQDPGKPLAVSAGKVFRVYASARRPAVINSTWTVRLFYDLSA